MKDYLSPHVRCHNLGCFLLAFILVVGFLLRMKSAIDGTFAYTYDVGRDLLVMRSFVLNHDIPFIGPTTGLGGVYYGPWWYYLLVPAFLAGQGSPEGIIAFMALTGVLSIFLGYFIIKKIGDSRSGLFVAGLTSFSGVLLGLSQQIWNPNLAPFFLFVIVYTIMVILEKKREEITMFSLFFLLGVLLFLSIDTEIIYGILLSVGVSFFFVLFARHLLTLKRVCAFFLGGLFILLPRIIFEIKHTFIMSSHLLTNLFFHRQEESTRSLLEKIPYVMKLLYDHWVATIGINNQIIGFFVLVFCLGILMKTQKKLTYLQKSLLKLIVTVLVTFYLGLLLYDGSIWPHYFVGLPVLFILFTGIIFYAALRNYERYKTALLTISVIFIIMVAKPFTIWKSLTEKKFEDVATYKNHLAVVDYIYKQADGKKFNYIVYTPPVHDYTYNYLFQWLGEKKYGYAPSREKEQLFFVILEPDPGYPDRLKKWLKIREKDGIIIKEELVKGGVIVQTRNH